MIGYLRKDGRKGIRNYVVVAYLVECAHHVARAIAAPFEDEAVQLIGFPGCYPSEYALAMMKRHIVRTMAIQEFNVRELAPNVVLVTYRVRSQGFGGAPGRVSVRSSIWVQHGDKWQVAFHQATLIAGATESV